MTGSVLVAYGTKHGSTGEVAEAIAKTLRESGLQVDLQPAHDVHDLDGYDAVVLGGSLYLGRLHPDVRVLLAWHREELARLPVAVFALGPKTAEQHDLDESRKQLQSALAKVPEVVPFSVAIFGGAIDPARLHFPFNHLPRTDARNWDVIHAWAEEIAGKLAAKEVALLV